jgi:hypothetical protein
MIIGEFNESNFDDYQEESYDYLFKRKSKPERQDKRLTRKTNKQQKPRLLSGKRKHPLLGNFGMLDKNKRKEAVTSDNTIETGVQSADMNVDATPPAAIEPEMARPISSAPSEPAALPSTASSSSSAPSGSSPDNDEVKMPSSAINAIVASEDKKAHSPTAEKSIAMPAAISKVTAKENAPKSNVKEAGFSSILGFAFLSVAIILAGFALFKADQKSKHD